MVLITWLAVLLSAQSTVLALEQLPLRFPANYGAKRPETSPTYIPSYEGAGMDPPPDNLASIAADEYTVLSHRDFPLHSIRIKKTHFCDPDVKGYTGYLDIEAKHFFFYFFESRGNPEKDDVQMWINGGPGCSSSLGLFMELGPCTVLTEEGPKRNPYSWNTKANLFFLDQPVGVGFSYAEFGESVGTTENAAKDVHAFVSIFFETFKQFKGRPFHMSGESYAGRYLPVFASEIVDQNKWAVAAGRTPVNLKSVLIGNGFTDFYTMATSYYDIQCTGASITPFQSISACVRMKTAIPRCQKWMQSDCIDRFDLIGCGAAMSFCSNELEAPFWATGKNPYDISQDCEGPIDETLCYPITKHITNYLNQNSTRHMLGVDKSVEKFKSCSSQVGYSFSSHLDEYHQTQLYVTGLLERGVRVLIYVGTYDWICNHVGNARWTSSLEWSGKESFNTQKLREWSVDGKAAGLTRSSNGLTFATVFGAGHMVPYDKPVEALALVNRWLAEEEL